LSGWRVRVTSRAAVAVYVACGVTAFVACTTDYQRGAEDPAYGAPNALEGQRPPRPTLENAGEGGTGSSGGGATPSCVTAGGTLVDAGGVPCPVSFANDVLKIFGTAYAPSLACGVNDCHGGLVPAAQPAIDPGKAADTYAALQKFSVAGKPYINPCSTETAASSMACNLQAVSCGSHMPKGGGQIGAAELAKIEEWLKCGSPNN